MKVILTFKFMKRKLKLLDSESNRKLVSVINTIFRFK